MQVIMKKLEELKELFPNVTSQPSFVLLHDGSYSFALLDDETDELLRFQFGRDFIEVENDANLALVKHNLKLIYGTPEMYSFFKLWADGTCYIFYSDHRGVVKFNSFAELMERITSDDV